MCDTIKLRHAKSLGRIAMKNVVNDLNPKFSGLVFVFRCQNQLGAEALGEYSRFPFVLGDSNCAEVYQNWI